MQKDEDKAVHKPQRPREQAGAFLFRDFQGSAAYSADKREGRDLQNALRGPYTLAPDCFVDQVKPVHIIFNNQCGTGNVNKVYNAKPESQNKLKMRFHHLIPISPRSPAMYLPKFLPKPRKVNIHANI